MKKTLDFVSCHSMVVTLCCDRKILVLVYTKDSLYLVCSHLTRFD